MRYGLPYKGSKNAIAEWVVDRLPEAENFYDLFCGGCAVTHAAMMTKKYKNFLINDIEGLIVKLFADGIAGKYREEKRWISREDFFRLKESDGYVKYCWSFGNKGLSYLYSKEVEPWKKALHYARVFNDFSLLREFGICTRDASGVNVKKNMDEWKKKYIAWYCREVLHSSLDVLEMTENLKERIEHNSEVLKNYLIEGLKKSGKRPCDVDRFLGTNGIASHYFGKSQWEFPTREVYLKLQGFLYLPQSYEEIYGLQKLYDCLQSLERLERLQSLERLERLQSLGRLERLQNHVGSYAEIEIKKDSVIYCDIPYINTDSYLGNQFDYKTFYDWVRKNKNLVVVSEYWMPEDFVCIAEKEKRILLNRSNKTNKAVEKLFVHESHLSEYRDRMGARYVPGTLDFF